MLMQVQVSDFNQADTVFAGKFAAQWRQVSGVLTAMPLHLKQSDQAGIQGKLIFDPVGTNAAIKDALYWASNVPMPAQYSFLGTDVDFVESGVLVEVQFSNYPFLLNNTVRGELLFKSKAPMAGASVEALMIITKAHMFPASNSTLYYEQAVNQLSELARNQVFDVPIRLVGLFEELGTVDVTFTNYHNARYSRTVVNQDIRQVNIAPGRTARSRCDITFA